jgi:hypothetical protein
MSTKNLQTGTYAVKDIPRQSYTLLTDQAANAKTAKNIKKKVLSAILHMLPGTSSGKQFCTHATPACLSGCLNTRGRGGIPIDGEVANNLIQKARMRRSRLFIEHRETFMRYLVADIAKLERQAKALGLQAVVRGNGTTDIRWEKVRYKGKTIFEWFPTVQFHDYSKYPVHRRPDSDLPSNYDICYSLAETLESTRWAFEALSAGRNVIAVVDVPKGEALPDWLIDGDEHDLRYLDPFGVVAVRAKGNLAQLQEMRDSGFARPLTDITLRMLARHAEKINRTTRKAA